MFKFSPKLSIILLAVSVLLIFLHYFEITTFFENLIVKALSPIQTFVYSFSAKLNPETDERCGEKYQNLIIENEKLKITVAEYDSLKKLVNLLAKEDYKYAAGMVLSRDIASDYQGLIINVGKKDGARVGLPVVVEDGILIGKIFAVSDEYSKVVLLTDSHSETAATINNGNKTLGIVVGEHGQNIKMELIPNDANVNVGDIAVTSGLEQDVPKGLIIGEIAKIQASSSFFKTAYLKLLVTLEKLSSVAVIIPIYD